MYVRACVYMRKKIIVNDYGKVLGDDQGDNYAFSVRVARIYRYLAGHDFQEESVLLVPQLSHPLIVLRRNLHAYYKGESGMEMVR